MALYTKQKSNTSDSGNLLLSCLLALDEVWMWYKCSVSICVFSLSWFYWHIATCEVRGTQILTILQCLLCCLLLICALLVLVNKQFSGCDLLCIGNVRKCRQTKQQQNSELLRLQENVTALQLERDRLKSETAQKVLSTMVWCHWVCVIETMIVWNKLTKWSMITLSRVNLYV